MILYMMAYMITNVVEQAFYVYKACTVNHGYNATICHNINDVEYKDILKNVQVILLLFIFVKVSISNFLLLTNLNCYIFGGLPAGSLLLFLCIFYTVVYILYFLLSFLTRSMIPIFRRKIPQSTSFTTAYLISIRTYLPVIQPETW